MTTEAAPAGRRLQNWLFAGTIVTVVVAAAAGAWVAHDRADRDTRERVDAAAIAGAEALEQEIDGIVGSLDGADAIAGSGSLDGPTFTAFGSDVLARTDLEAISLVAIDADGTYRVVGREGFGGVAPALGADIRPAVRSALRRAAQTGGPVAARAADETSAAAVVVARPVTDPSGLVIGFVAVPVPAARMAAVLDLAVPAGVRAIASTSDVVVVGEPFEGRAETAYSGAAVVDRPWLVTAGPRGSADLTTMWATIAAGVVGTVVMASLAVVTGRRQRRMFVANAALERGRDRDRAVQSMLGHLARAITATEVVVALRDLLPPAVGAHSATLGVVVGDGTLHLLRAGDRPDDPGERLTFAGSESVVERILTDREPAWLSSPLEWRHDELAGVLSDGGNAMALLPLQFGEIRGALAISYDRFHVFDPDEQQVLATVAVLAGQALDRGHRYDTEHAAAVAFQKAALPDDLPDIAGLAVTARYRPALRHAAVGGDWYDVVALDDRRTLLVVGDVVGHGMEAAAAMGRLRTALRVIATLDPDPGTILRRLGQQVDAIPGAFCTTVLCAVLDRDERTFTWSRAGHLPPLLVTPGGTELLDQPCAPPLGVVIGAETPVHSRELRVGDRLMLFTDGIVERRSEGIDIGLDRLAVMAATLSDLDHAEFTDTLVEAIVPHEGQVDDIAILVVALDHECAPAPTPGSGSTAGSSAVEASGFTSGAAGT